MLYVKLNQQLSQLENLHQQVIDACCAFDSWTEFKSFSLQELRTISSSIVSIIENIEIHHYVQKGLIPRMLIDLGTSKDKLIKLNKIINENNFDTQLGLNFFS